MRESEKGKEKRTRARERESSYLPNHSLFSFLSFGAETVAMYVMQIALRVEREWGPSWNLLDNGIARDKNQMYDDDTLLASIKCLITLMHADVDADANATH